MNEPPVVVNGCSIYAHPLFLDQLDRLVVDVENARRKDPVGYKGKRAAKLLAAVLKVAFEIIPSDPTRDIHRQGATLGDDHKHWFRAKFLQQFRLFFRYHQAGATKVIVLAWVNDETTLRAYGSSSDAYAVFRRMLKRGHPPDDWDALLAQAAQDAARRRTRLLGRTQR